MKKTLFILAIFALTANPISAADDFNPAYIISDNEILDKGTMSLKDIQEFLSSKNGYLASYSAENFAGEQKTAAEIIYDAAVNNYDCDGIMSTENITQAQKAAKCDPISINPQFLLVLLQKEQSLIDETSPKQSQLDWAAGYGCPDGGGCNERWKGFGKQVNSAALQFSDYMTNPGSYKYQPGQTYVFTNPYDTINNKEDMEVTPANLATAALYNYTPHVYNGNYNFWKLWRQYFSKILIEGSLVQIEGEAGIWLIQDGKKRPFLSKGALTSRYDINKVITVKKADLDGYLKGAPIKFAQYSLLMSLDGKIYLLVDDNRRRIINMEVFRQLGYNPEEVEPVSNVDLSYYEDGEPITEDDLHPAGALMLDPDSNGVYFVINKTKAPLIDPVFLKTKFKHYTILKPAAEELAMYKKIDPVKFEDGYLLKSTLHPAVYVVSEGKKRAINSGEVFEELGYKWENIMEVHPRVLALYDNGEAITTESLQR